MKFYAFDIATGVDYGTDSTYVDGGLVPVVGIDADYVVTRDDTTFDLVIWGPPVAVTTSPYLRQRQSPRNNPSRLGISALRQRQTPFTK